MAKTPNIDQYDHLKHGFEGGLYSGIHESAIRNTVAKEDIPFGRLVEAGTDGYGPDGIPEISVLSGTDTDVYGVSLATDSTEQPIGSDNERGYPAKKVVPVLVKGVVNVVPESDVNPSSDVYARVALDGGTAVPEYQGLGRFTAVEDGTNTAGPYDSLRFLTEGKAGETVGLEVGVTIF